MVYQSEDRHLFLSDVVDESNGDSMSVGFARYGPGESNEWVVTYDEALVVTGVVAVMDISRIADALREVVERARRAS
jgi:ethanolamine utilization protein EutQ (cupin superfamily)